MQAQKYQVAVLDPKTGKPIKYRTKTVYAYSKLQAACLGYPELWSPEAQLVQDDIYTIRNNNEPVGNVRVIQLTGPSEEPTTPTVSEPTVFEPAIKEITTVIYKVAKYDNGKYYTKLIEATCHEHAAAQYFNEEPTAWARHYMHDTYEVARVPRVCGAFEMRDQVLGFVEVTIPTLDEVEEYQAVPSDTPQEVTNVYEVKFRSHTRIAKAPTQEQAIIRAYPELKLEYAEHHDCSYYKAYHELGHVYHFEVKQVPFSKTVQGSVSLTYKMTIVMTWLIEERDYCANFSDEPDEVLQNAIVALQKLLTITSEPDIKPTEISDTVTELDLETLKAVINHLMWLNVEVTKLYGVTAEECNTALKALEPLYTKMSEYYY